MPHWSVYTGNSAPHDGIDRLPEPPPWRAFDGEPLVPPPRDADDEAAVSPDRVHRARAYVATAESVQLVNAALVPAPPAAGHRPARHGQVVPRLRGRPRAGSRPGAALADQPAAPPCADGLYQYDALSPAARRPGSGAGRRARGRLPRRRSRTICSSARWAPRCCPTQPSAGPAHRRDRQERHRPAERPAATSSRRAQYEIPELSARRGSPGGRHRRGAGRRPDVARHRWRRGRVRCRAFPFVVLTSNGEREFPPAFLRRCVRLKLPPSRPRAARRHRPGPSGHPARGGGTPHRPLPDPRRRRRTRHRPAAERPLPHGRHRARRGLPRRAGRAVDAVPERHGGRRWLLRRRRRATGPPSNG